MREENLAQLSASRRRTKDFVYFGSTTTSNLPMSISTNASEKATSAMSRLTNRVWENGALTLNTRVQVYKARVLSILLYGSVTWTTYAKQEHRLNTFHLRCRILGIKWLDHIPNTVVIKLANTPNMYVLLSESRWETTTRDMSRESA